ncbi:MAG: histidine--tRNA ligase [Alphaproteobacteria bacterium]|nr:histidine--tRNA ligase [Alphaproteobacteria bacterium]
MAKDKPLRPKARLPRGFRDRSGAELAAERRMLETVRGVYETYGFSALETPAFEYTDALGKFLPDVDRPNEGVFSLRDEDEQWLSLRYDLTAPLARYVAENFQDLPKPFRRYAVGRVWRNEKPGPGRFREFTQFDADTVGSASPAADAELLMMVCDVLKALGLQAQDFALKVNNRKLLDAVLDAARIEPARRGVVLRAIDKLDRLGIGGVRELLGTGRKDESGDFTKGAELETSQVGIIERFLASAPPHPTRSNLENWWEAIAPGQVERAAAGLAEIAEIFALVGRSGHQDRIHLDPTVVRGLDYYTGPVFEAQLTFPVTNEAGEAVIFGSVAGGGRYDDLVARFTGQSVPATGISIGVSRLMSALMSRGALTLAEEPLVLVLAMGDVGRTFELARQLRQAGIRAEAYVGTKRVPDQLKYADKRGAAIAVIEGEDERTAGTIILKDLALGLELAKSIETRAAWVQERPAQTTIGRDALVEEVTRMLGRQP